MARDVEHAFSRSKMGTCKRHTWSMSCLPRLRPDHRPPISPKIGYFSGNSRLATALSKITSSPLSRPVVVSFPIPMRYSLHTKKKVLCQSSSHHHRSYPQLLHGQGLSSRHQGSSPWQYQLHPALGICYQFNASPSYFMSRRCLYKAGDTKHKQLTPTGSVDV
jgi:hypothetical protein